MSTRTITEQQSALRLSVAAAPSPSERPASSVQRAVDEVLEQTFPASDPPAWWAGPAD